jgi:ATP-dependent helicase/nuclease subunit B
VLRTVFDAAVANLRSQIPAPSDAAAQGDMDRLWVLALSFLQFEQHAAQQNPNDAWQEFEFAFGVGAHRTTIPLHDRRQLPVLGFVDRIDRRSDGTLRIVDYKTGRARGVWDDAKRGAFDGGRKLQPVMYAMAVAQEMRTPVSAFAYRFPKEVATKMEKVYNQDDLANGAPLLDSLIAHLDAGTFVPTNDASDCKYCDYQSVCRAMPDQHGSVASPRAEFGKRETANAAYAPMRQRRGDIEEAGDDE